MSLEIVAIIAIIFLLLALSAFFNGSETALTAASRARMHTLEEEGSYKAGIVNKLLRSPERLIGAVLLGNTLVDVLASALASGLAVTLVGDVGVIYATVIMTVLIVIFGAVLPKTYALAWADKSALLIAPLMRALVWILTPFTVAIQAIVRFILRLTPTTRDDAANILAADEELRGTIELQKMGGGVADADAAMLGGVLDLKDLQVLDVMVHRTKMEMLNADEAPEKIIEHVLSSHYTRFPMWKVSPDNIVGVLHTKDLLGALQRAGWDATKIDLASVLSPPWYVPDTTNLNEQLSHFLKRKAQLALVVDEYGEVQGLVTLEDILEEIVGQIADEHDTLDMQIRPQPDGAVNVDGTVAIRDLNRAMDWSLPDEEATTVAGLIMHEAQTIPEAGQAFTFYGYRFEVARKQRNRIVTVRVRKLSALSTDGNISSTT
jgi:Mg2+/Co2+ transporter CorB